MTIEERFLEASSEWSDQQEHMHFLRGLAAGCGSIREFGVRRGMSTVAFLAGKPKWLFSYDICPFPLAEELARDALPDTLFKFEQADTRKLDIIPCDLLFVDTLHTADQIRAELLHGDVARMIAIHDTAPEAFGVKGEDGGEGIRLPIQEWLEARPHWRCEYETDKGYGMMLLKRVG